MKEIIQISRIKNYQINKDQIGHSIGLENAYSFDITQELDGRTRIKKMNKGYKFNSLKLLDNKEESFGKETFLITLIDFHTTSYPNDPNYIGNETTNYSKIEHGITCSEDKAQSHCKNLTEKLRNEEIKKYYNDRKYHVIVV